MRFSLIVCTIGRRDEIGWLFDSLLRQGRSDFELILVDQNKDDRLVEIVSRYQASADAGSEVLPRAGSNADEEPGSWEYLRTGVKRFPLTHLRVDSKGASRARNAGIDLAIGELIGFPDDDCKYVDGYLNAIDQLFSEDLSIGCIAGYPTSVYEPLSKEWAAGRMDLNKVTLLNRCQEFTLFVRKQSLGDLRYNELLGVGAGTLWGADEAPDLLVRLVQTGCRLVYYPRLYVYHPDKIATVNAATLHRAASYSRGRGALFRLHKFPKKMVFNALFRPAVGCILYLLRFQPMRALYYFTIFRNTLRGLLMSRSELEIVRANTRPMPAKLQPSPCRPCRASRWFRC